MVAERSRPGMDPDAIPPRLGVGVIGSMRPGTLRAGRTRARIVVGIDGWVPSENRPMNGVNARAGVSQENEERGFGLSHFDPNLGVEP